MAAGSDAPGRVARLRNGAIDGTGGRLHANIMHFARVLRKAGLPIGPGQVLDAVRAVETAGIADRRDFYWTLHAVFVNRRDQRELFDQAFHVFWRNPRLLERMMSLILPETRVPGPEEDGAEMARRLADALFPESRRGAADAATEEIVVDAAMTWSDREVLRGMDFETMSAAEEAEARLLIRRMTLPLARVPTRRYRSDPGGPRVDMRRSFRLAVRSGGDVVALAFRRRRERPPPLVILCDISGSMSRYSRMALHFMHAVTNDRDRVHSFVFGTRLTHITRQLCHRDVDKALEAVAAAVEDWSGGTRLGACLAEFNRRWARRVLAQGPLVVLISDGLDRDAGEGLAAEAERLHKSCRRLIWLNPLLRYDAYQPKSMGARALLPHVDDFRPVHNLDSLGHLVEALARPGVRLDGGIARIWQEGGAA